MQPTTAGPRAALTEAQVVNLIQGASAVIVGRGCELLDMSLGVLDDITADLLGGSVSRAGYADLHGSATLELSRELDWGTAIVRPFMTLSDGTTTAKFHLGAYFTSASDEPLGRTPATFSVTCYDILHGLHNVLGESYAVAAGTSYLSAVEAVLIARGYTAYLIDQASADKVLPSARAWPLDGQVTWLGVINDLLASIGYQGIWSDWDGQLRCNPYDPPVQRASEWLYDRDSETSIVEIDRTISRDFFDAPNQWVSVRSNNIDGTTPVQGDGIYTYTNQRSGPTSVEARGGRIITRYLSLDVADQTSLVARATASIDADLRLKVTMQARTGPNPLHWHFDRLVVDAPGLGAYADMLSTKWTLPLDGAPMTHEWAVLL